MKSVNYFEKNIENCLLKSVSKVFPQSPHHSLRLWKLHNKPFSQYIYQTSCQLGKLNKFFIIKMTMDLSVTLMNIYEKWFSKKFIKQFNPKSKSRPETLKNFILNILPIYWSNILTVWKILWAKSPIINRAKKSQLLNKIYRKLLSKVFIKQFATKPTQGLKL